MEEFMIRTKTTILALALAVAFPIAAVAETIYDSGQVPNGGGLSDPVVMDTVEVIGTRQTDFTDTTIVDTPGRALLLTTGNLAPIAPVDKTTTAPDPNCLTACAANNTVNLNVCTQEAAKFKQDRIARPFWGALGGFVAGWVAGKGPGAVAGLLLGYNIVGSSVDSQTANVLANCQSTAARDYNFCLVNTCHALFVAPLLLALRRRRKDEQEVKQQLAAA
jgi:hypothetical protein